MAMMRRIERERCEERTGRVTGNLPLENEEWWEAGFAGGGSGGSQD